jgi:hypothetical protein
MRNKFLEELKLAAFRKKKQASSFFFSQFALSLQTQKRGVMLEWLKRHAWKACIRQKRIASSNLAHSAKTVCYITARCFFIFRILKITAGSNGKTGNNMLLPVCFHSCDGCHHPRFTLTPAITHSPGCFTAERS